MPCNQQKLGLSIPLAKWPGDRSVSSFGNKKKRSAGSQLLETPQKAMNFMRLTKEALETDWSKDHFVVGFFTGTEIQKKSHSFMALWNWLLVS
jgi:hypothetical protein